MNPEYFSIDRLVKTELPPLPVSVMRLTALLSDFNNSQNTIATAISYDPILSARLLRRANSSLYALQGTVTNLGSAVSAVGINAITEMLLIGGIGDAFGRNILNSEVGKKIWLHLVASGVAASEITRLAGMRGADEAFSCGLLHDIGKLIMLKADANYYIELMERARGEGGLSAVEQKVLGFDHAELGAEAAVSWNLPEAVCHIIRFHHHPSKATSGIAMAHIVNIADEFVTIKMGSVDTDTDAEMDEFLKSESLANLGLDTARFGKIWETVEQRLDEMADNFS